MNDKRTKVSAAVVAIVLVAIAAAVILYPHEIEVSWEGEGDVTPDGGSMRFYESMDLRIEPADGWTVGSVTVDGEAVEPKDDTYSLTVSAFDFSATEFHVVFVQDEPPETHIVTVTSTDGGSISPSGSTTVYGGGSVTFTITPDEGHALSRLLVDGEPVTVAGNTYTLRDIRADHTVHAVFEESEFPEPETHMVTITSTANGTVTPSGTVEVGDGEDLTLIIVPDDGYAYPDSVRVTNGTASTGWTYDPDTGIVTISSVKGAIKITGTCDAGTYSIIYHDGNETLNLSPSWYTYNIRCILPETELGKYTAQRVVGVGKRQIRSRVFQ